MAEMIESDEIELSLGLSLNGRFGVDPKSKILKRASSSAPNFLEAARVSHVEGLERTWSLPVEVEEETRKRKEAQMLRRLEAKRKLCEKQRSCRKSEERREIGERVNGDLDLGDVGNGIVKRGCLGYGLEGKKGLVVGGSEDECFTPLLSQGSLGSSAGSDLESQTPSAGIRKGTKAKSPQSVHSFSEQNEYHPVHYSSMTKRSGIINESEIKQSHSILGTKEMVQKMLADMPCVSTKGDGPNGKRVEGFLYGYRKGEQVTIVCVCHGSLLSPAEFIKHAGGGDVEHPLRHIVVNPSPCSSFAKTQGGWMAMSKTF